MVEGIKSGHAEKPLPTFPVSTFCFSSPHLNPASALKINGPDFSLRASHGLVAHGRGVAPSIAALSIRDLRRMALYWNRSSGGTSH
jgi:hypothetical protein